MLSLLIVATAIQRIFSIFSLRIIFPSIGVLVCELTAYIEAMPHQITSTHSKKSDNWKEYTRYTSAFFSHRLPLPRSVFILLLVAHSFGSYPLHVSGLCSFQTKSLFPLSFLTLAARALYLAAGLESRKCVHMYHWCKHYATEWPLLVSLLLLPSFMPTLAQ